MALPDNFSPAEHLQDVIKLTMNREVREWFRDVGADDWEPDLNSERARLRVACTHIEDDTFDMTVGRLQLFYFLMGQAQALQAPTFIDMTDRLYEDFTYKPELVLYFYKNIYLGNGKYENNQGRLSYRLVNETSQSLTPAKNRVRAEKIKNLFASPTRFVWHKGKTKFTYLDLPNGYDFRLLAINEAEARRIIEQVLDIENRSPDWDKLFTHIPEKASTTTTQRKLIYGKQREVPRWRPVVEVVFARATMKIHGIPKPIPLVDCISGIPIVQVAAS
jgi:hypothetical protein